MGATHGVLRLFADRNSGRVLASEIIAPRVEHLGILLAWATEQRTKIDAMLRMHFHHPVIEGALKAALSQLHAKVGTRNPGPIIEVALAAG
jgi:dihydrolipoamide dehydrogenase